MRRFFTIAAFASLAACVASGVTWIRSYGTTQLVEWSPSRERLISLRSESGRLGIIGIALYRPPPWVQFTVKTGEVAYRVERPSVQGFAFYGTKTTRDWQFGGFQYTSGSARGQSRHWAFIVPWWSVMLVTAVPPVVWLRAFARRPRRIKREHLRLCRSCGYDLRSGHDRCPECGAAV